MASKYDFYYEFQNKDTNVTVAVYPGSEYQMRNDGLDGFNSAVCTINRADYAHARGAALLGGSIGAIERTVTIYDKSSFYGQMSTGYGGYLRKCFSPGSRILVKMCRYRGTSSSYLRQAECYVQNMKASEGNIYEPRYITATLVFLDPVWQSSTMETVYGSSYAVSTTSASTRFLFSPVGETPTKIVRMQTVFTTTNTESVTLTQDITLTMTITRPSGLSSAWGIPETTTAKWIAFSSGALIGSGWNLPIAVTWDYGYPRAVINGSTRNFISIDQSASANIFHNDITSGKQNTVMLTLGIPSGQIGKLTVSSARLTYYPLFLGE